MTTVGGGRPTPLASIWSAANRVTWQFRERLAWRRNIRSVAPVSRGALLRGLSDPERASLTLDTWLPELALDAGRLSAETAWIRDALDLMAALEVALGQLPAVLPNPLRVLDVGAKTWHYVRGIHALLRLRGGGPRDLRLTGVEIDAFRVYRDLHSRWDWAHWHASTCPGTSYLAMDAFDFHQPQDLVLLFLPIMFEEEHLDWGLSLGQYRPDALFTHARRLAGPEGHVVMLNFAYEEPALDIIASLQEAPPLLRRPAPSALEPGELPRILTVWRGLPAS